MRSLCPVPAAEALCALFRTFNAVPNSAPSWNVAPTQDALVVRRHPETGDGPDLLDRIDDPQAPPPSDEPAGPNPA